MPRPLILPLPLFLLLFSLTLKHTLSAQLDYEMENNESQTNIATLSRMVLCIIYCISTLMII